MVRHPGMSRGCAECRKRRVKCDERVPSCTRCLRIKRSCSGATTGNVFLAHVGTARKSSRQESPRQDKQELRSVDHSSPGTRGKSNSRTKGAGDTLNGRYQELNIIQSFNATPHVRTQVVALFFSFFSKSGLNNTKPTRWMTRLHSMLTGVSRMEYKLSVLSAALALFGTLSGNLSCGVTARKYYGMCLTNMRARMVARSTYRTRRPYLETRIEYRHEDASMALMLAYYEIISSTSEMAYSQHILGAEAILKVIGPEMCQIDADLYDVFLTIRVHRLLVYAGKRSASTLATEAWTNIPFETRPKSTLDHLIDLIMQIHALAENQDSGLPTTKTAISRITTQLSSIGRTLHHSSNSCQREYGVSGEFLAHEVLQIDIVHTQDDIPDSETIITSAYYSLAWLLISIKLRPSALSAEEKNHQNESIMSQCSNILRAGAEMDDCRDGCGYIRLVYPLRVVATFSPDPIQRESAEFRLQFWKVVRGLNGICNVALSTRDNTA